MNFRCTVLCLLSCFAVIAACKEPPSPDHEEHERESEHHGHEHEEGGDETHGAHPEGESRRVKLSADVLGQTDIEVVTPRQGSLKDIVRATAVVNHDVNRVAHIAPMVEGQIAEIHARLGDEVKSGEKLATMRSVSLGEARADVQDARATLEVAKQNHERQKQLVDKGIGAQRTFIEAKGAFDQAKARYDATRSRLRALGVGGGSGSSYPLKSHINGTIIEQHASIGETKNPQDELFVVADQSVVWVIGQVAEQDTYSVKKGMKAIVVLDAYPQETFEGKVDWIGSTIDQETRLLPIRVELENPDDRIKPGMFGAVQLSVKDSGRSVPLVPVDAVQQIDGKPHLFTAGEDDGSFVATPVKLGAESGGAVEILEGLPEDARVVTRGAFDLKATMTAGSRDTAHAH